MIRLLANYRDKLSITVKTLNQSPVRTVIQSNVECGDQDTDLNPVFLLEASWLVIRSFISLNSKLTLGHTVTTELRLLFFSKYPPFVNLFGFVASPS